MKKRIWKVYIMLRYVICLSEVAARMVQLSEFAMQEKENKHEIAEHDF